MSHTVRDLINQSVHTMKNRFIAITLFISLVSLFTEAQEFREVSPDKLVIMETTEGNVYIELAPQFAPNHVTRFTSLTRQKTYDNTQFYRVIEGFVAQGGPADSEVIKDLKSIAIEAKFPLQKSSVTLVQERDLFAPFTGFLDEFAVGMNADMSTGWLLHCPGVVAMARGNEANSAKSDFYIVIGQAPRFLDKIMTVFGRVVYGLDVVQRIKRGKSADGNPTPNGTFEDNLIPSKIQKVSIASDLPKSSRPGIWVEKTSGPKFEEKLHNRRNRTHSFFFEKPPLVLDACQVPLKVKVDLIRQ